jgi:hypothetical protein
MNLPCAISKARNNTTAAVSMAAITNTTPMSDRPRRLAPRTISAPNL